MANVDLNDQTLKSYENTKNQLIGEAQSNYNNMVNQTDQRYNELIQASKDYTNKQTDIQNQKTNQTIVEINQNKDKTKNDYTKQQKAAYADYARQTNDYGVTAEQQAAAGLQNSGYSESSKVNLFNTYQNRVAAAKESFDQAMLAYDNQITQAKIANSSVLAEIAYNGLVKQTELSLESFKYKNDLLNNLTQQKLNISSQYDNLWQSQYKILLDQAQYNEDMAFKKAEAQREQSNWQKEYALKQQQLALSKSKAKSSSGGSSGTTLTDTSTNNSNVNNSSQEPTLSANGQRIYDGMSKLKNGVNANLVTQMISDNYKKGKINETDVRLLTSKMGLS